MFIYFIFFFKQKTAYELRKGDWSSDVCSSDLHGRHGAAVEPVAFHDRGVHLDRAGGGEHGAAPGIEAGVILERAHRALDSIERGPTLTEHLPAFEDGGPDAFAELVPRLPGIGTG